MTRWILALALLVPPSTGYCLASQEQLKGLFAIDERILLSGLLTDPQQAAAFLDDGQRLDNASFMILWRSRLAAFCEDYLSKEHPVNEKAKSLRQSIEPAEWAMLMASLRALEATGAIKDQITLKIFLGMIEEADKGLADGDPSDLRRVIKLAKPKLTACMRKYLSEEITKKAVAEQARRDAADNTALEQAEAAEREAQAALQKGGAPTGQTFDGANAPATQPSGPVVAASASGAAKGASGLVLRKGPGALHPSSVVPSPDAGAAVDDDMIELNRMKQRAAKAGGKRRLIVSGAGLAIGAAVGMMCGGPLGMVIGGLLGAAVGFFAGKLIS